MRRLYVAVCSLALLALVGFAGPAYAQSAIAGVVTDTSGAVLPGVTVEARSPALIEQVRTAFTDERGQYRVVDLRPGTYTVTFSLGGFNTVAREGIQLQTDFTAPLNVEMKVGAVSETITVTGASPVVDLQSTTRRDVVSRDLADNLPTARSPILIGQTLPAVNLLSTGGGASNFDVGGNTSMALGQITAYGGTGGQSTLMDGMRLDGTLGNGLSFLYLNEGAVEQYVFQVNGGTAESALGVVMVNMIPRSGGNSFSGNGVFLGSSTRLQATNISDAYRAQGLSTPAKSDRLYDVNFGVGGPIVKDRAWFYSSYRDWTVDTQTNIVNDQLAILGPAGSRIVDRNFHDALTGRATLQASQKHRFSLMYEKERYRRPALNVATNLVRPEAANYYDHKAWPGIYFGVAKWSAALSNKFLVETGVSANGKQWLNLTQPNYALANTAAAKLDTITGISYGNVIRTFYHPLQRTHYSAAATYVTGSHSYKVGFQGSHGTDTTNNESPNGTNVQQQYRSGVPFGVNVYDYSNKVATAITEFGFFAQDSWTIKKLTLNPGIRYDNFVGSIPQVDQPASRFFPARTLAAQDNIPNWKDVSLRLGGSYDLGGGKTVIKGSVGKFLQTFGTQFVQQYNPAQSQNTAVGDARNWTDTNGDDIAQDNEIGPTRNANFGLRVSRLPDADLRRPYDLLYNLTFERELAGGVAVGAAYNRRDSRNLSFTRNLANPLATDWELLTVADPRDATKTLPVYQVLANRVTGANQLDVTSSLNRRAYDGVDFNLRGRLTGGTVYNVGTSTGRIVADTCDVTNPNNLRFCEQSQLSMPFLTIFKASATVPFGWHGARVSAVYQSVPGAERTLNYTVTRAQLPALTTATSVVVRLNEPQSEFLPRINNLDLAGSFVIKLRGLELKPQVDLFNVFNINNVLTETNQFPTQYRPLTIVSGRMLRFGVQYKF